MLGLDKEETLAPERRGSQQSAPPERQLRAPPTPANLQPIAERPCLAFP